MGSDTIFSDCDKELSDVRLVITDECTAVCVTALPATERFFLWAIRAWSAHHTDLSTIWWSLDHAFAQQKILDALASFDLLMSSLFAGLKRWPDIRCVACPRLGADEQQLLRALSHLQRDNVVAARAALQVCALASAARVMSLHAQRCARIASLAGLRFDAVPVGRTTDTHIAPCAHASPMHSQVGQTPGFSTAARK